MPGESAANIANAVHATYEKKLLDTWATEQSPLRTMFDQQRKSAIGSDYKWPVELTKGETTKQDAGGAPEFEYAETVNETMASVSCLNCIVKDTWMLDWQTVAANDTPDAIFDISDARAKQMVHRVRDRLELLAWIGGANAGAYGGVNDISGIAQAIAAVPDPTPDGTTIYGIDNDEESVRTDGTVEYRWHPYVVNTDPDGNAMTKAGFIGQFRRIFADLSNAFTIREGYQKGLVIGKEPLPRGILLVSKATRSNLAEALRENEYRLASEGRSAYEVATGAIRIEGFSVIVSRFTDKLGTLWSETGVGLALDSLGADLCVAHLGKNIKVVGDSGWNPVMEGPYAFLGRSAIQSTNVVKDPSKLALLLGIEA